MDSTRYGAGEANEKSPVLETALWAQSIGLLTVPIARGEKNPNRDGWQQERHLDPHATYAGKLVNIGGLWGEPSGGMVDIDLDHLSAVELAPRFLPATGRIYGRKSKRCSHWLYQTDAPLAPKHFRFPSTKDAQGKKVLGAMIAEIRSTGQQSVLPGSVHPSGEAIEWDNTLDVVRIPGDLLRARVEALVREVGGTVAPPQPAPVPHRRETRRLYSDAHLADRCRAYLAKIPDAIADHGGHSATLYAACLIRRFGVNEADAWELLNWFNEQKCEPVWTEKELRHKFSESHKLVSAKGEMGSMGQQQGNEWDGQWSYAAGAGVTKRTTRAARLERRMKQSMALRVPEVAHVG